MSMRAGQTKGPAVSTGGSGGTTGGGSENAPQIFVDGVYLYYGSEYLDGSWRQFVSGTDLVFEHREAGVWVQKGAIAA